MNEKIKTTVIHHSADYDGIFCREIARKFMPEAELIGWDFKDEPLPVLDGQIYVMDLPVDRVFGFDFVPVMANYASAPLDIKRVIWIDHHASSIASHPTSIPGYRIDGVAACRLAWQWFIHAEKPKATHFTHPVYERPSKQEYLDRKVEEPLAVCLAGEYDVWDHRGDGDVEFQFGMDAWPSPMNWNVLLSLNGAARVEQIIEAGRYAMACYAKRDADVMRARSFLTEFENLKFLTLNTARCNSNTFASLDIQTTGHDALLAFAYDGRKWNVSLYHAKHRTDLDLSWIAVKHGGGGHRGACGFAAKSLKGIIS